MPQKVSSLKIWMYGHVFGIILASSFQNKVNIFFEVTDKGHFPNWILQQLVVSFHRMQAIVYVYNDL